MWGTLFVLHFLSFCISVLKQCSGRWKLFQLTKSQCCVYLPIAKVLCTLKTSTYIMTKIRPSIVAPLTYFTATIYSTERQPAAADLYILYLCYSLHAWKSKRMKCMMMTLSWHPPKSSLKINISFKDKFHSTSKFLKKR